MIQESSCANGIPFLFFESLVRELGKLKPYQAGRSKEALQKPSKVLQTLQNWIAELRRRFSPLPPDTLPAFFDFLFPEEDNNKKYGLQETKLALYLDNILPLHCVGSGFKEWNSESSLGCLGSEVEKIMSGSHIGDTTVSMSQIRTYLTELAANCSFSSPDVLKSSPNPRGQRTILKDLYMHLSPASASIVTQIILKDLRPLLYPLHEIHYSTSLSKYKSNAVKMLTKEDAMMAWDPSGRMLRSFKVQGTLSSVTTLDEGREGVIAPQIGIPVSIPKCLKGQSCAHALSLLKTSQKVWAETKYDGERAQIHVELDPDGDSRITIFSKSKRDSTMDRIAIHPVIRDALGLPSSTDGKIESSDPRALRAFSQSIILEAEMVAFSEVFDRIDEFWRIRSLIATTAVGARCSGLKQPAGVAGLDADFSQVSMISDASDGTTRHLALVFFDVILLDSVSLLNKAYSERRAILESVVTVIPGYSMLAERVPFINERDSNPDAKLREHFARLVANYEEGIVLKAEESRYNQGFLPWVKLKKDYVRGYGDTLDVVILGAAWDRDRARELRVTPTVYTTFYLGALTNADLIRKNPDVLPHFLIFFTSSYGLSREQLEDLNFRIKSSDLFEYRPSTRRGPMKTPENPVGRQQQNDLPYTFNVFPGIPPPTALLHNPMLAEVFGAGFTKAPRSKYYELRFPRISKVFQRKDRPWLEGVTLSEFQIIAREAVGKDRSGKDIEDWCNNLWGKPISPGVRNPEKRKQREEEWIAKLEIADGKGKYRRKGQDDIIWMSTSPTPAPLAPESVINVASSKDISNNIIELSLEAAQLEKSKKDVTSSFLPSPSRSPPPNKLIKGPSVINTPRLSGSSPTEDNNQNSESSSHRPEQQVVSNGGSIQVGNVSGADNAMSQFLQDAVVWFAKSSHCPRPLGQAHSTRTIPIGQRLNTLGSLLTACGWQGIDSSGACQWVRKGVIFVDDNETESTEWKSYLVPTLAEKRAAMVSYGTQEPPEHQPKPIWVFSSRVLGLPALGCLDIVESRAICKLG